MGVAVGIDLGTTNSVVARVDGDGRSGVIPNAEGRPTTPSVVCFRKDECLVGQAALEQQLLGDESVVAFFKRQMGDRDYFFEAHGKRYSAIDLSALVLDKLKRDAEAHLGEKIDCAVITVPAYFRDPERRATIRAGEAIGLKVLQVINEPTAAALAYGLRGSDGERHILVYDLGGGTFDATLLKLSGDVKVIASDGDHKLGGKDWDDRIVQFLSSRFEEEYGYDPLERPEPISELLARVEIAKRQLSELQRVEVVLADADNEGRYTLDRKTLNDLTGDLLERTESLVRRMLDDVGLSAAEVDGVLLVGGSTRMTMVHELVKDIFGNAPLAGINVDEAVALGAAIAAYSKTAPRNLALPPMVRATDVTNHSLGMIALNQDRSAYLNSIILPKNREIPSEESRPYLHRPSPTGDPLEVYVTQGESESPADVVYLGRYLICDVEPGPDGSAVLDIQYQYDESGTVSVAAHLRGSTQDLLVQVEELPDDVPERFLRPPTPVSAEPVTAYLAFDLSGSMSGDPLKEAQKAAMAFLEGTDLAHCSLGIIAFSDRVRTKLTASQNSRKIRKAIESLSCGETGDGNLTDPFDEVLKLYDGVKGHRFVVTLADGVWANQSRAIQRAKACHRAGIESIAIGFGGADENFLRDIASSDEDSFFTSMTGLTEAFSTVAQVITERGGRALATRRK